MSLREREKPTEVGDAIEESNVPEPVVGKGSCGATAPPLCGEGGGDTLCEGFCDRNWVQLPSPPVVKQQSIATLGFRRNRFELCPIGTASFFRVEKSALRSLGEAGLKLRQIRERTVAETTKKNGAGLAAPEITGGKNYRQNPSMNT